MSRPQFQFITKEIIIYLDFIWSLHGYANNVFCATQTWKAVYERGELELFEDVAELKRTATSRISKKYLQVTPEEGFWDQGGYVVDSNLRLRDIGLHSEPLQEAESEDSEFDEYMEVDSMYLAIDSGIMAEDALCSSATSTILDPQSSSKLTLIGTVADGNSLSINTDNFEIFSSDIIQKYVDNTHSTPLEACKCLLRLGMVELPRGQLLNRHYQALRGQTLFYNLLTSDRTVEQILNEASEGRYVVRNSVELNMHSSTGALNVGVKRRKSASQSKVGANDSDENQLSLI